MHNVKGYGGKELVFCNYTSELRAIKFAVCECTGYRERQRRARDAGRCRIRCELKESDAEEAFPAVANPDQRYATLNDRRSRPLR